MRQEISYKYEERDSVKEGKEREAWLDAIRDMNLYSNHLLKRVKQKIEEEDEDAE